MIFKSKKLIIVIEEQFEQSNKNFKKLKIELILIVLELMN